MKKVNGDAYQKQCIKDQVCFTLYRIFPKKNFVSKQICLNIYTHLQIFD